jgi:hypothetical protein
LSSLLQAPAVIDMVLAHVGVFEEGNNLHLLYKVSQKIVPSIEIRRFVVKVL